MYLHEQSQEHAATEKMIAEMVRAGEYERNISGSLTFELSVRPSETLDVKDQILDVAKDHFIDKIEWWLETDTGRIYMSIFDVSYTAAQNLLKFSLPEHHGKLNAIYAGGMWTETGRSVYSIASCKHNEIEWTRMHLPEDEDRLGRKMAHLHELLEYFKEQYRSE